MNVIAVLNQKGGVGKTTTAINLAAYLALAGKRILLLDFDPQGNSTSGLGIDKNQIGQTVYQALTGQEKLKNIIIESHINNLDIAPANTALAAAEVELAGFNERERQLARCLDGQNYDIVLIDCPPSLGLLTVNALTAADWLLIPVQAEYYALEGISQLLDIFQRVKSNLNQRLELMGVVLTMYDKRTSLSGHVKQELTNYFKDKLFKTIIPRNIRLAEAPSFGRPIHQHDKWSKGAKAYKNLAKEVLKNV